MGFQFNHVGGGTKTRRPICLHMKYNSACKVPHCLLVDDCGQDQEMSLEELQEYIERENQKLNADNKFLNKDIIVKIHYRYCPNLTIVDTPGTSASFSRNMLYHIPKNLCVNLWIRPTVLHSCRMTTRT
jgi:hypothetical protein